MDRLLGMVMSFTFHAPEGSTSTLGSVTLNKTVTTECLILSTPPISHYKSTILSSKKFYACFFSLALCIIVSAFDSVVVPTTIPTLTIFFHAGSVVQLVSPVYLMSNTSLQMLYGRFSDIIGRKTSLSLAIFIFVVGTLASGFSRTLIQLLIFRAIAGAGGGGIITLVQIVISDIITVEERAKFQTIIGGIIAFGYAIGPLISGAFLEKAAWRWCFWISAPISVGAFIAVIVFLPSDRTLDAETKRTSKLLTADFVGAILIVCGCIALILPLIWGGVLFPWNSPPVLAPLFCGLLTLAIFCIWEWKVARFPILPMYIFKYATVTGVYITTFLYGFIHFSSLYYIPQFLQVIMGYNPIKAGIFFIPFLVATVALSWIASFIVNHTRSRPYKNLINCGYFILTIICGIVLATTRNHVVEIVTLMIVAGAGAGQTLQTPIVAVQNTVSKEDLSAVTAFRNFIRCLGGTFTLAVGSSIINYCLRITMADLILSPSLKNMIIKHPASLTLPSTLGISPSTASIILEGGYAQGFKMIFVLNAALTAVATIISILMVRDHKPTGGDQQSYSLSIDSEKTVHAGETTRTTHIRVEMATDMMRQIPLHMTYPPSAKLESAQKDIC